MQAASCRRPSPAIVDTARRLASAGTLTNEAGFADAFVRWLRPTHADGTEAALAAYVG